MKSSSKSYLLKVFDGGECKPTHAPRGHIVQRLRVLSAELKHLRSSFDRRHSIAQQCRHLIFQRDQALAQIPSFFQLFAYHLLGGYGCLGAVSCSCISIKVFKSSENYSQCR